MMHEGSAQNPCVSSVLRHAAKAKHEALHQRRMRARLPTLLIACRAAMPLSS